MFSSCHMGRKKKLKREKQRFAFSSDISRMGRHKMLGMYMFVVPPPSIKHHCVYSSFFLPSTAAAITGGGWCVIPLSDLGNHKSLLLIPRNGRKKSFECMFVSVSINCSSVKVVISLTSKFNQHMAGYLFESI